MAKATNRQVISLIVTLFGAVSTPSMADVICPDDFENIRRSEYVLEGITRGVALSGILDDRGRLITTGREAHKGEAFSIVEFEVLKVIKGDERRIPGNRLSGVMISQPCDGCTIEYAKSVTTFRPNVKGTIAMRAVRSGETVAQRVADLIGEKLDFQIDPFCPFVFTSNK